MAFITTEGEGWEFGFTRLGGFALALRLFPCAVVTGFFMSIENDDAEDEA